MLYYSHIYLKYNTKEDVIIKQIIVWQTCQNLPYQPSDFTAGKWLKKGSIRCVNETQRLKVRFYDNHMSLLRFGI